jgi:hypothetical protein
VPPRAPLPTYQRQYSGSKYPQIEQQAALQGQKYKYKPRDVDVQPHYQKHQAQAASGKSPQRTSSAPRQEQTQSRASQPPREPQQPQRQQQPQSAPRPPEQDHGSKGNASQGQPDRGQQDRGSQDKGAGHSSGQGQPKDSGKGEQGGGQKK